MPHTAQADHSSGSESESGSESGSQPGSDSGFESGSDSGFGSGPGSGSPDAATPGRRPEDRSRPRAALGAIALRGGRTWLTRRPTPYLVVGGLFWLVMTLAYWRVPLCCDAGLHAAVVERLRWDLLHPAHPTAALPGTGSPYYSPYAVAQGVLARLTGLSGWSMVKLAGPVNLLVLLTGVGRFARVLTPRPWAPVLALLFMTLPWGTERAPWSDGLGLMSMTTNLGRPSAFAIGLTFWAWAWTGYARVAAGASGGCGTSGRAASAAWGRTPGSARCTG